MNGIQPKTAEYGWPSLNIRPGKIDAYEQALRAQGTVYSLGAKAPTLGCDLSIIKAIDCSGFVRDAVYRATKETGDPCIMPDGSVNQLQWCIASGFKVSSVDAATLNDGGVRIAFLTPDDAIKAGLPASERHVMLVTGGHTDESHGGIGPDERPWLSKPWMKFDQVFVLTPP